MSVVSARDHFLEAAARAEDPGIFLADQRFTDISGRVEIRVRTLPVKLSRACYISKHIPREILALRKVFEFGIDIRRIDVDRRARMFCRVERNLLEQLLHHRI